MSTDICRWLFLLFFLTTWTTTINSKEIRVVCYYTNWSAYRPGTAKFVPQNINPYLCTHLIYAFGGFTKENTLKPFDKYADIEKGGYAKFTGLKTYNKNLKTMLAIGGWNEGSSRFSPMVANPERRKELVKNAIKFLRQNHFDGLDLDWEYPNFRDGGKPRDKDNYAQLVQELREEFDRESEKTGRPRLLLTMAVPAGIEYINKGYDVPKLTKYLDWMNILNYDYHSAYEPSVNHHSPLYSLEEPSEYNYDADLNIDYTIKHYLKLGAEPNKLVMGIPTYGRSYTLFNPDANEIGAPADGPGDMGEATRENGFLSYYEICERVKSQDWEVVQPNPDAMGPYAFKDQQWVAYDDDAIARKKAEYVAENDLGGIMFWSIDNDDFRGTCHGKAYPIVEAAKEALIAAYGLSDDNLISPPAKPTKPKTRTRLPTPKPKQEDESKISVKSSSRRRNRPKPKPVEETTSGSSSRAKLRRKDANSRRTTTEATIYSSLELVTPSYTTPAPPSTPDQGGGFKCEDEGFFPHPKDCKKYYWCLSGAGDTGIVAHSFTCPAGLYFNKAADSCDYTRNVLCNKKLTKSASTTTTTEAPSSTTTPKTSTARVPPRITAATSRTTIFRTSTTTQAYEEEYEEYDDEEETDGKNSEEDPKVIKELLDLIKKAGGIEELEKQLKVQESGGVVSSSADANTTPPSISKSLVAKVLGKAAAKNAAKKNSYSFLNRNSRGPQNEGLNRPEEKDKKERGRLQYTSIARARPQKTENEEENDEDDEEEAEEAPKSVKSTKKQPEYVNIRRGRFSTTAAPEENSKVQVNRNKILGEDLDDEEDEEVEDEDEKSSKKSSSPQYVNIRRQRPSTTEATATSSKYTSIRRGTTPEPSEEEEEINSNKRTSTTTVSSESKYKILRRSTTTQSPPEVTQAETEAETTTARRRGTTTIASTDSKTRGTTVTIPSSSVSETEASELSKTTTVKGTSTTDLSNDAETTQNSNTDPSVTTIDDTLTTPENLNIKSSASLSTTDPVALNLSNEDTTTLKHPLLSEPRPFSLSTPSSSTTKAVTETSTRVTKVSETNYKLRVRQRVPQNDSIISTTTTVLTTEKPTPFRTRAPSRFKLPTASNSIEQHANSKPLSAVPRSRARFSTTTEINTASSSNNHDDDIGRTYRPAEIADLSSLTAVDFSGLRDLNRFGSSSRSRRPRPSTTEKIEESEEEPLKTGPKTLTAARKYLDNTTFGKSRRVLPVKHNEDQVKSETSPVIRGFSRSTANPDQSTTETSRATLRSRKIIRRFRPTSSPITGSSTVSGSDPLKSLNLARRIPRPTLSPSPQIVSENLIESASTNPLLSRKYTRISSTTPEVTTRENEEQNETDDVSVEEDENIKLSESNIRENSNVNNNNALLDDGSKVRKKILKRVKSKVGEEEVPEIAEKGSTEPNVIIRTRKIIRKLKPTEASSDLGSTTTEASSDLGSATTEAVSDLGSTTTEASESTSTVGRKRKIIRRLRPTTESGEIEETTSEKKTLYIRGRAFPTTESEKVTEEVKPVIDRTKYKTINRGTTSTTPKISSTSIEEEEESEDLDHEEETEVEDEIKKPQILLPESAPIETSPVPEITTTSNSEEDVEETTTEDLAETTTFSEEDEANITTTTVRNYINPILTRQKNRPVFVRPKLSSTSSSSPAPTISSRTRGRQFSRGPSIVKFSTTEKVVELEQTEKKFVPRGRYANRVTRPASKTSTTESTLATSTRSTTTETVPEDKTEEILTSSDSTTTFDYSENSTEIEITTPTLEIVQSDDNNSTLLFENSTKLEHNSTVEEEAYIITTEESEGSTIPVELTTVKLSEDEIVEKSTENLTDSSVTEIPNVETTSIQEISTILDEESLTTDIPTSTDLPETSSPSTTTISYILKSTLKSIQNRPKFSIPKRFGTTSTTSSPVKLANRFSTRNKSPQSTAKILPRFTTPSPAKPRFNFKTSTTQKPQFDDNEEEEQINDEEEEQINDEEEEEEVEQPIFTPKSTRGYSPQTSPKPKVINRPAGFFKKPTTEATKPQDLGNIDKEAVKNRNKNLFSKKRKMNVPISAGTPEENLPTPQNDILNSTTPEITESVTKPTTVQETTELPTTLHHIFAEPEGSLSTTQSTFKQNSTQLPNTIEKLIEVNRIVEVHEKNFTNMQNDSKTIDKIGVVNRVKSVKVVDGSANPEENEVDETTVSPAATTKPEVTLNINGAFIVPEIATVREITNEEIQKLYPEFSEREERKFEIYSNSKVNHQKSGAEDDSKSTAIIDGQSQINVITPKPFYSTEASTIALQGLFQTDTPQKLNNFDISLLKPSEDELLETGNSRFVNIRVLGQNEESSNKDIKVHHDGVVPIRVLPQDDYITMKAEVVEVTPKINKQDVIKIVPIRVEMSRKLLAVAN